MWVHSLFGLFLFCVVALILGWAANTWLDFIDRYENRGK